ncbi:hypothetical protein FNV43_RR26439 [Rhamnella rubrinervis]|uniref:Uncharacterized protein n=1 Tax=Rhamnella rubrinervis TaxID=2594499 RepID=A0A8K0DJQ1_9ROSA|nr:hypothetical protein FNV43_RR26439 [Rhamnella rubrinervis]
MGDYVIRKVFTTGAERGSAAWEGPYRVWMYRQGLILRSLNGVGVPRSWATTSAPLLPLKSGRMNDIRNHDLVGRRNGKDTVRLIVHRLEAVRVRAEKSDRWTDLEGGESIS